MMVLLPSSFPMIEIIGFISVVPMALAGNKVSPVGTADVGVMDF